MSPADFSKAFFDNKTTASKEMGCSVLQIRPFKMAKDHHDKQFQLLKRVSQPLENFLSQNQRIRLIMILA